MTFVVGERYAHDVFVSYAYAKQPAGSDDLGLWGRAVAETIERRLSSTLNGGLPDSEHVKVFRDDVVLGPGTNLSKSLKEHVKQSAVIVVILSNFYWGQEWCRDEFNWWMEDRMGKSDQEYCFPILAQDVEPKNWPPDLKDERGKTYTASPFMDEFGQPLGLGLPKDAIMAEVQPLVSKFCAVLVDRLKQIREREIGLINFNNTKDTVINTDSKIIFLEAETEDELSREEVYRNLEGKVLVVPEKNLGYMEAAKLGGAAALSPKEFYGSCNGLVLVRSREDDKIELRITKAARDRSELQSAGQKSPAWAVINELPGTPVPSARMFRVPVIDKAEGWVDALLNGLR